MKQQQEHPRGSTEPPKTDNTPATAPERYNSNLQRGKGENQQQQQQHSPGHNTGNNALYLSGLLLFIQILKK